MIEAPSSTARGQAWLDNFAEHDRKTATVLLDSVRFATTTGMRSALESQLNSMIQSGAIATPAVLAPAQDVRDLTKRPGFEEVTPDEHVVFETFDLDSAISATPGSEGWIGSLVRTVTTHGAAGWLSPSTSKSAIGESGKQSCRSLVLLSDYAGSGAQLERYARAIVRHPQIRAWRSAKYLRIVVVVYAATPGAVKRLAKPSSPIDQFFPLEVAPTLHEFPRLDWQPAVLDLCRTYSHTSNALGYLGSAGLFVSDSTIPNNLPAILLQRGRGWKPFFDGRHAPSDVLREIGDYSASPDYVERIEFARQLRISRSLEEQSGRREHQRIIAALVALNQRRSTTPELCLNLGVQPTELAALLAALETMQLIAADRTLTSFGKRELNRRKYAPRKSSRKTDGSLEPYYPQAMR